MQSIAIMLTPRRSCVGAATVSRGCHMNCSTHSGKCLTVTWSATFLCSICPALPCALLQLPPGEMRELLRGQWGMGEHLADAITSVWGGEHFDHAVAAITGSTARMTLIIMMLSSTWLNCSIRA